MSAHLEKKLRVIYIQETCKYDGSTIALKTIIENLHNSQLIEPLVVYAETGAFKTWMDEKKIKNIKLNFCFNSFPETKTIRNKLYFLPKLIMKLARNFLAKRKLTLIIQQFKPDILHTNTGPIKIGFDVAKKKKIIHIWHIREYQKLDFNIHYIPSLRQFKKDLNHSYAISITRDLYDYFQMGKNARVIYDGVMDQEQQQFIIPKEKYFLFVGRLEDAKGILLLIDAFGEFAKMNKVHNLLIAGTGTDHYLDKIKSKIQGEELNNRIILLGFREDRYNLMAKATAIVVPSRNEGFGFITAEAMFNGCLVIGNNTSGTREIIANSEGNAIPFIGKNELIKALFEVVNNGIPHYYNKIKKAEEIATQLYSRQRHANEVYNFYVKIQNEESIKVAK